MTHKPQTSLDLTCPSCTNDVFELRVIRDEGLATTRCVQCNRDYLLLDSEDHWFDVIQAGYPRQHRCSCRAASFRLRCDYVYRDDGDIKSIDVWSTCASCARTRRQMSVDIDYCDTDDLATRPLRYCKTPKLLYDLKDLSLYVTKADIASIIEYFHTEHECRFVCWFREQDHWVMRSVDGTETSRAVRSDTDPTQYLRIYALPHPMVVAESDVDTLEKEASFWKRHELIRISSPTHMGIGEAQALLFYISFSNEYVEDDIVVRKSAPFRELTNRFLSWMQANFVSWRGPLCFDSPTENARIFGDRFSRGQSSGQHR